MLFGLLKSKTHITSTITHRYWANPFDSDWCNVINAGRYFTYTDAARWEIAGRTGFLKFLLKNKWVMIAGGQKIIYRRPVKIFRRFHLKSKIVGWDDKWIYTSFEFKQHNKTCSVLFTKLGIRSKEGLFSPINALSKLGQDQINPPDWVLKHFQDDIESLNSAAKFLS